MTVARFVQPNYTTQSAAVYKAAIDAAIAAGVRLNTMFAPHQAYVGSPNPDRVVEIDAGYVFNYASLTEVAAQSVSGFTTPSAGTHRIDRVVINASTGAALRVEGTAATGSPTATAPAIPSGYLPCCRVLMTDSDTVITDSMITDERAFSLTVIPPPRVVSIAAATGSPSDVTVNVDVTDMHVITGATGGFQYNNPSGTPSDGQKLVLRLKDNGVARAVTFGSAFRAMGTALPSSTVASKTMYIGLIYNSADAKWDCLSVAQEA